MLSAAGIAQYRKHAWMNLVKRFTYCTYKRCEVWLQIFNCVKLKKRWQFYDMKLGHKFHEGLYELKL